jgi:hypothetical protein
LVTGVDGAYTFGATKCGVLTPMTLEFPCTSFVNEMNLKADDSLLAFLLGLASFLTLVLTVLALTVLALTVLAFLLATFLVVLAFYVI